MISLNQFIGLLEDNKKEAALCLERVRIHLKMDPTIVDLDRLGELSDHYEVRLTDLFSFLNVCVVCDLPQERWIPLVAEVIEALNNQQTRQQNLISAFYRLKDITLCY